MFFHFTRQNGAPFITILEPGCQDHLRFEIGPDEHFELLGDPVFRDRSNFLGKVLGSTGRVDGARLFDLVPGHYYWFHWRGAELECGSSFCGLLPIYHHEASGRLDVSSSSFAIARANQLRADDLNYQLERSLFNYPLFDRTPWKRIRRLPAQSKLVTGANTLKTERFFRIEDHFGDGAGSSSDAMRELCEVFERECDLHIPGSGFALSFTGGFDGRTLLGAALKLGRSGFSTYGFGIPGESDITLPQVQARELGVPYAPILLDDRYLNEDALSSALAFMELSDHAGNLGRPHYHYAARSLAKDHTHLVTGNFGSELFRALHAPGALMTDHLVSVFGSARDAWHVDLTRAAGEERTTEVQELITDLEAYLAGAATLRPTQRFYRFVFDELFRKYFGPEIVVQSRFLRNRTPFLSLRFIKALHQTVRAGVHARLFETRKFRRLNGQVFYAAYLKRAHPGLYRMPTNKGYAPRDVLERWRIPLLAAMVFWHRLAAVERVDSNSIDAFFQQHRDALLAHYGLEPREGEDLQGLSNRAAWAAACRRTN